jgi:hypothetical protein
MTVLFPNEMNGQNCETGTMADYIYDNEGKNVAWIDNGQVFSVATKHKVRYDSRWERVFVERRTPWPSWRCGLGSQRQRFYAERIYEAREGQQTLNVNVSQPMPGQVNRFLRITRQKFQAQRTTMKLWFPVVVLIAAAPSIANAAEAGQAYGIGMRSCGEFAQSYAAKHVLPL